MSDAAFRLEGSDAPQGTTPVTFTQDELWLLQRTVRHESAQMERWRFPYASHAFNDLIAGALWLCCGFAVPEVTLPLRWSDLLIIDATVHQDTKDADGKPLGKAVLLKSYAARAALRDRYGGLSLTAEPAAPTKAEVLRRLRARSEDDHAAAD
jgi:hypothetical protein